jgi:hypothetical protein
MVLPNGLRLLRPDWALAMRKLLIPFINVGLLIVFNREDGVDLLQLIEFQVKLDYPLPILEQVLGML